MYRLSLGEKYHDEDRAWFRERDRIRAQRYPASERPYQSSTHKLKGILSTPQGIMSVVGWPTSVQLDYDYLPPNVFVAGVKKALKDRWVKQQDSDLILPIMSSGHVKNMHNASNLDNILREMTREFGDQLVFWTVDEAVRYWNAPERKRLLLRR
jgi:hypothetical protein